MFVVVVLLLVLCLASGGLLALLLALSGAEPDEEEDDQGKSGQSDIHYLTSVEQGWVGLLLRLVLLDLLVPRQDEVQVCYNRTPTRSNPDSCLFIHILPLQTSSNMCCSTTCLLRFSFENFKKA